MKDNREILFRGKVICVSGGLSNGAKQEGEWVEGCYFYDLDPTIKENTVLKAYIKTPLGALSKIYEVIPETVGQMWTSGLIGKIFEGDIEEDDKGVLSFGTYLEENEQLSANAMSPQLDEKYGWHWKYEHGDCSSATSDVKVIGSIHDNPELIN